jgi:ATP-dependent DNA helicase RecQ
MPSQVEPHSLGGPATGPDGAHPVAGSIQFDLDSGLRRLGHTRFRPGQREAIERLLAVGRLLLVAPTGGGKSLVYQLPATLLGGTTLVVSPLISLMQDQVRALEAHGIAATYLASTLDAAEMRRRLGQLGAGRLTLAYVAPERLAYPGFRALLRGLVCPLVAVDEAHCISEWGHDFRPEYLELGAVLAALQAPRVFACTATATPVVRDEILVRLGLPADTPQIVQGFARPNLALRAAEVEGRRGRARRVDALLAEALDRPGAGRGTAIVYAGTRRQTETECARLQAAGWTAAGYHAGLDGPRRHAVQQAFAEGRVEVVVATNAFGMGIDRPDVRAVVHLAPPGSIEAYYQEVGRAGRDGRPAIGLLLTAPGDIALRRRLLERTGDGEATDGAVLEHKWGLFLELLRWVEGGSCRHDAILRYFGDEVATVDGCGRCDECLALREAEQANPAETTLIVRKALSGVARVSGRFGIQLTVKLLRGEPDPRLERSGLAATPTFGNLREHPAPWLLRLLRRCVTRGWATFSGGDRPMLVLTEDGRAVMKGERPARLRLPPASIAPRKVPVPSPTRPTPATTTAADPVAARTLFEALRRYRLTVAREQGWPPYVVASDRTLRELAELQPRTPDELRLAHGIGPLKIDRYGPGLLAVVSRTLAALPRADRPDVARDDRLRPEEAAHERPAVAPGHPDHQHRPDLEREDR